MTTSLHPVRTAKALTGAIAHELAIGSHVLLSDSPLAAMISDPIRTSCSTQRSRAARR